MPDTPAFTGAERLNLDAIYDDSTIAVEARMQELSRLSTPTITHRTELAALVSLTIDGEISTDDVWDILRGFHYIGRNVGIDRRDENDDPAWLAPLHQALATVWSNIGQLVAGQSLPPAEPVLDPESEDPDEYDRYHKARSQLLQQWFEDVMLAAQANLRSEGLSEYDMAPHLPYELVRRIEHEFAVNWHGSPYAFGASLEALPLNGGTCFGDRNGPVLLDILVNSLTSAIDDYTDPNVKDTEVLGDALMRLKLHWMILKGFVHSMTKAELGTVLVASLPSRPELHRRTASALLRGFSLLQSAKPELSTMDWTGRSDSVVGTIVGMTPTGELVDEFNQRVANEAASQEALRNLR
jgi:hypothetical protein